MSFFARNLLLLADYMQRFPALAPAVEDQARYLAGLLLSTESPRR